MKTVFSSFLILTLLSSAVVGPLSVSSYSVPVAYAETSENISDISNYVIYGLEKVEIDKGVTIQSGNVGLHDDSKKKGEIKIKKNVEFVNSESVIVANKIKIEKDATAPNVYYNKLDNKGTVLGTENTPLDLPVVNNLPEFPIFEAGNEKIKVEKNESKILSPGDYGKIELKKHSIIIFEGGVYNIESLKADDNSKILFESRSEIRVEKEIKLDKDVTLGPLNSEISASDILFFVGDDDNKKSKIKIKKNSQISAKFYSPNGKIEIDENVNITGTLIGKEVKIKKDSVIQFESAFNPISGFVEKYENLIIKLGTYDDFTLQTTIDDTNNDLKALRAIVLELQELGVTVSIKSEQQPPIIGSVLFFDTENFELFEVVIPNNSLSVLATLGVVEESDSVDLELSAVEIDELLNIMLLVMPEISNSDEDSEEFSLLFIVNSVCIGVEHAVTCANPSLLEESDIEIIQISSNLLNTQHWNGFLQSASAQFIGAGLGGGLLRLVGNPIFQEIMILTGFDFSGSQVVNQLLFTADISGFKFNDVDFSRDYNVGESGLPGWKFVISAEYFGQEINLLTFSEISDIDGQFEFSDTQFALTVNKIFITEIPTNDQTAQGWVNTTPMKKEILVDFDNLPENNLFNENDFGNRQEASVIVITQVTNDGGGILEPSDFRQHVSAMTFAIPPVFDGQSSTPNGGVLVKLIPGEYEITQDSVESYTTEFSSGCFAEENNPIAGGAFRTCVIDNTFNPPTCILPEVLQNGHCVIPPPPPLPILDIVIGNGNDRTFTSQRGHGDGGFSFPFRQFVMDRPWVTAVGDFNNDGLDDVAVGTMGNDAINILLSTGNGWFDTPKRFAGSTGFQDMVVGDFNGDGNDDVAFTETASFFNFLLGQGNGNLGSNNRIGVGGSSYTLAVNDFNKDGIDDVIIQSNQSVRILYGQSTGEFISGSSGWMQRSIHDLALGDFNGDGNQDVVVSKVNSPEIAIRFLDVDGTFGPMIIPPIIEDGVYRNSIGIATGDFNNDGYDDIVFGYDFIQEVEVLTSDGVGGFEPSKRFAIPSLIENNDRQSIAVADFNRDGIDDIIMTHSDARTVSTLISDGVGGFESAIVSNTLGGPRTVSVGNFFP